MLIDSTTLKEPIKPKAGSTLNNMRKAELIKEDADDVAPVVHGRWEEKGYVCGESEFECSVCHKTEWRTSISRFRWCPFCGARMDGDSDAKEN